MRFLLILVLLVRFNSLFASESWTAFRGTNNDGLSNAKHMPLDWGEEKNIKWKTPIHDIGYSSPVVLGDQIWVTTATESGDKMYAVCISLQSGKILHDILVLENQDPQRKHALNSYATPTPVIEDKFVYTHFGTFGTACIHTLSGKIIWKRTDIHCDHEQGPASSPIIYKNLLIVHHEGREVQTITALDKSDGETVWQVHRPEEFYKDVKLIWRKAYITPIIIQVDGKDQLVSNGAQVCQAFDPLSGKELWRVAYGTEVTVVNPIYWDGLVYINTGLDYQDGKSRPQMWAVNPDGTGDVTNTHVAWKITEDVPGISTPVVNDDLIFMGDERGKVSCIDAKTGKLVWKKKLRGQFNCSPLWIDGKIYFTNLKGKTFIIKAGTDYKKLEENQIDGQLWATPAVVGKSLIFRTGTHIYRIEE